MAVAPRINPETVEALLDTTWRVASAEAGRTESLDRKAATLATFASLVASLTATLGLRSFAVAAPWEVVLVSAGLLSLVVSVLLGVVALLPREHLTLGVAYLETFSTWAALAKEPHEVRGETMNGVIRAIAHDREANARRTKLVTSGFLFLLAGLVLVAVHATTLGLGEVL